MFAKWFCFNLATAPAHFSKKRRGNGGKTLTFPARCWLVVFLFLWPLSLRDHNCRRRRLHHHCLETPEGKSIVNYHKGRTQQEKWQTISSLVIMNTRKSLHLHLKEREKKKKKDECFQCSYLHFKFNGCRSSGIACPNYWATDCWISNQVGKGPSTIVVGKYCAIECQPAMKPTEWKMQRKKPGRRYALPCTGSFAALAVTRRSRRVGRGSSERRNAAVWHLALTTIWSVLAFFYHQNNNNNNTKKINQLINWIIKRGKNRITWITGDRFV